MTEKKPNRNPYLPALPDGYAYSLQIAGPDGQRVVIEPAEGGSEYTIATTTHAGSQVRQVTAESLDAATRQAVRGVKALQAAARQEAEAKAARETALAAFGEAAPDEGYEDVEPSTPDAPFGENGPRADQ